MAHLNRSSLAVWMVMSSLSGEIFQAALGLLLMIQVVHSYKNPGL